VLVVDAAQHVAAVREKGLIIRRADGSEQRQQVPARTPDEVTDRCTPWCSR
jgi:hypothetical protein